MIQEMNSQHEREILMYQDKVKYLLLKIDSLENEKLHLQNSNVTVRSSNLVNRPVFSNHKEPSSLSNLKLVSNKLSTSQLDSSSSGFDVPMV